MAELTPFDRVCQVVLAAFLVAAESAEPDKDGYFRPKGGMTELIRNALREADMSAHSMPPGEITRALVEDGKIQKKGTNQFRLPVQAD